MIDLTNKTFGRLTVIKRYGRWGSQATWLCLCECGKEHVAVSQSLRVGGTRSCGCLRDELRAKRNRTHGLSETAEFSAWERIFQRCYNPKNKKFHRYGMRGIKVCNRWSSFMKFLEDMGPRPSPRHSIDRIDNDGNYTAGNCRWATMKEQARNTSNNRIFVYAGEAHCVAEWAEIIKMKECTLRNRLNKGWAIDKAMTTPVRHMNRRNAA